MGRSVVELKDTTYKDVRHAEIRDALKEAQELLLLREVPQRQQQDGAVRPAAHLLHLPGPVPDA